MTERQDEKNRKDMTGNVGSAATPGKTGAQTGKRNLGEPSGTVKSSANSPRS